MERRRSQRVNTNKFATIILGDQDLCACVIKDVSDSGARLLVLNRNWVPKQFEIQGLDSEKHITVNRVWQDEQQIGVSFEK